MNFEIQIKKFKTVLVLGPLIFTAASCNTKTSKIPLPEISFVKSTATIGSHILNVEVAQTQKAQEKGLGGRDFLAENNGMIFLFQIPGRTAFWMKDTKIPLDFIWVKDGKVVEITKNVQPEPGVPDSSLRTYQSAELIDSTIEVNAGWSSKNNIKVGDSVMLQTKP